MIQVASAPLPALIRYYDHLEKDPSQSVADFGFSRAKVHFQLVLGYDGSVADLVDIREIDKRGRAAPKLLAVPFGGGRPGIGVKPFFCWDNTGYVLGRDNKGKPARAEKMFAAFRKLHLDMRNKVGDDESYAALCRFLESWDPSKAEALPGWEEATGLNIVFKLRGQQGFVHQSEAVKMAWRTMVGESVDNDATRGVSLVSGKVEDLARLHEPAIKGIIDPGGPAEKKVVAFNKPSFTSYGKDQSFNAPVGVRDAFRYSTALNRLLADDSRRVSIGDATVVFWTDRAEAKDAEEVFAALFAETPKGEAAESGKTIDRLRAFLEAARQGRLADAVSDPDAPFYVLGLSPSGNRINVRFWLAGTVAQFAQRLTQHAADLEMTGAQQLDPPLVIRRLLLETAREPKNVPPQLAGELARAVLSGMPYPQALFSALIRRVRVDAAMNHRRAAILKAFLVRNRKWEVPVALDKDHPDEAYHLGRLFSALEKTQEDASEGKLNSTIKDRFFGAASASPATVFPQLLRLHQHHIDRIENTGWRVNREKLICEICSHITRFPPHLALEKQGLFHIAYYHQRQDFFTKKDDTGKETTDE